MRWKAFPFQLLCIDIAILQASNTFAHEKKKVHIYGRDNRNAFSISSPAFQDQTLARSFLLKNIRRSAINLTQFRTNFVSTAHKFRLVGRECPKTVFGKKQQMHDRNRDLCFRDVDVDYRLSQWLAKHSLDTMTTRIRFHAYRVY